ncbi:MAG: hydrogenase iron-sulfur subunit, partial [Candidatus Rokubacteria bacterium]|nr:hydrogenase iron-sulfur subunit [Candidatus Rokubacteria bacterium]
MAQPAETESQPFTLTTPARAGRPARGHALLGLLQRPFLLTDRALRHALPDDVNPLLHTGAVANTLLLVAVASGVLLLLWYVPSLHQAWLSLDALKESVFGQLMRSVHRYSSDACVLFILLHAVRALAEEKFSGARWLAWVTGVAAVGLTWLVGWLGYWLVWDTRARQVALGTARLVDDLPVFAEPLSRSFLTDGSLNTFLFFVVFFLHMLLPLAMVVALWLHITRLTRPRFLANRALTAWILVALVIASLVVPAHSTTPARMLVTPGPMTVDGWYLLPLWLTDRLSSGALWLLVLLGSMVCLAVPWALGRGRPAPSQVQPDKCNNCQRCFADCPFNAISMAPREDARHPFVARVDASKCVGCGICAGSCDSSGIGLPWLAAPDVRPVVEAWVTANPGVHVVFGCGTSAAGELAADPVTGCVPGMDGLRMVSLPCAGWVHPLTVERLIKRGASRVTLVACAPGSCQFRFGATWAQLRHTGARPPILRTDEVDPARVRVIHLDRTQGAELRRALAAEVRPPQPGPRARARVMLAGVALAGVATVSTVAIADIPY